MLAFWLLIFSMFLCAILLSIHDNDEIHQLMAWLSGLIAVVCILILTPLWAKGLLGILYFAIKYKFFPAHL